uniref:Uncharacterized protein n=1 Tax=Oryza nivara TaxID=4536 RepID=A0A0E0GTR9_ORYNI
MAVRHRSLPQHRRAAAWWRAGACGALMRRTEPVARRHGAGPHNLAALSSVSRAVARRRCAEAGRLRGTDARDRAGHAGPCRSRSAVVRDSPLARDRRSRRMEERHRAAPSQSRILNMRRRTI